MRTAFGHRRRLLACAGAILVVSVGVAYAAIPHSQSGVISGCFDKKLGLLRVIDAQAGKTCFSWETAISWNQKGPTGATGAQGSQGPQGTQGLKGDKGDTGDQGIQGLKGDTGDQGLQGLKGDKGDTGDQGLQGLKGDKGDPGDDGADGAGLESLDQVDGLPCTRGGEEGTTDLTYDGDGFARLQCVVENEPTPCVDDTDNGTPASVILLGSVSGDTGNGSSSIERTARLCSGSDWWRVRVTEDDQSILGIDTEDLTAGIGVEPTSGDPNLYLYCGSGPNLVGSSANSGLQVEIVQVGKADIPAEDDFDVLIEVRGSAVPTDYTLFVTGDVLTVNNTC